MLYAAVLSKPAAFFIHTLFKLTDKNTRLPFTAARLKDLSPSLRRYSVFLYLHCANVF